MNILLDTCTFLWIIGGSKRLSPTAERVFRDPGNTVYLSAVSVWEIMVKTGMGRLRIPSTEAGYLKRQRDDHGIAIRGEERSYVVRRRNAIEPVVEQEFDTLALFAETSGGGGAVRKKRGEDFARARLAADHVTRRAVD